MRRATGTTPPTDELLVATAGGGSNCLPLIVGDTQGGAGYHERGQGLRTRFWAVLRRHLYSSCRRWRRSWNSPIRSFSFLRSAAVIAVRVRSLLLPTPHPCRPDHARRQPQDDHPPQHTPSPTSACSMPEPA